MAEAKAGIGAYLDYFNRVRPHQALGYQTPEAFYLGAYSKAA
jgi:transposase InsO family protein